MNKRICFLMLTTVLFCSVASAQNVSEERETLIDWKSEQGNIEVVRDGLSKRVRFFYSDGSLFSEKNFVWNIPHGDFKFFYPNGQVSEEGRYFLGFKTHRALYYDDGSTKSFEVDALQARLKGLNFQSNVHMHPQAGLFFDLANLYLKDGRKTDARKTFEEGIRLAPFDYKGQLALAKMDIEDGFVNQAAERLRFIQKDCKDKKILSETNQLLAGYGVYEGEESRQALPVIHKILYVAVTAQTPQEVRDEIIDKVEQQFGVEVKLLNDLYVFPADMLVRSQNRYLDLIIGRAFATLAFEQLNSILKKTQIEGRPQTLDQKKEFYKAYIAKIEGEGSLKYRMNTLDHQLDADLILDAASAGYQPVLSDPNTFGVLIVTVHDLRADDLSFLFGTADIPQRIGVMSVARFALDQPSMDKLKTRAVKQAFSTVGFIAGIGRCTMPDCARAYPHSLAEHDKKPAKICSMCFQHLIEAYQTMGPRE